MRRVRTTKGTPSVWNTKCKIHRINIGESSNLVPMFPCFMGLNSDHFYITYGFNQGYMFIFKHLDQDSGLKLFGLVEPTPVIDKSYWTPRHLEKNFVQIHRE